MDSFLFMYIQLLAKSACPLPSYIMFQTLIPRHVSTYKVNLLITGQIWPPVNMAVSFDLLSYIFSGNWYFMETIPKYSL
jgi:hypothetical protein